MANSMAMSNSKINGNYKDQFQTQNSMENKI